MDFIEIKVAFDFVKFVQKSISGRVIDSKGGVYGLFRLVNRY